jgi:hypothetical protein
MQPQRIVARYANGRVLKGHTSNFNPNASHFLLAPESPSDSHEQVVVEVASLKAIFFVKDFAGNPKKKDRRFFVGGQPYQGHKIKILFADGEEMLGYTPNYDSSLPGFFVFPADPDSNMVKAFAVAANIRSVTLL